MLVTADTEFLTHHPNPPMDLKKVSEGLYARHSFAQLRELLLRALAEKDKKESVELAKQIVAQRVESSSDPFLEMIKSTSIFSSGKRELLDIAK